MSKKIKVCRTSGLPVEHEDNVKYNAEFTQLYDKVMKKLNITESTIFNKELSVRVDKLLSRSQRLLLRKYPVTADWDMIMEEKDWVEKIKKYGPIMCVAARGSESLTYVILDTDFALG